MRSIMGLHCVACRISLNLTRSTEIQALRHLFITDLTLSRPLFGPGGGLHNYKTFDNNTSKDVPFDVHNGK